MAREARPDPVGEIQHLVDRLREVPGVEGCVLARNDGLVITHNLTGRSDARRVAAMAAAIVNASRNAIAELDRGSYQVTMVQSSEGVVVCASAGLEAIFAVVVANGANLGLVLLRLQTIAGAVEEQLEYI